MSVESSVPDFGYAGKPEYFHETAEAARRFFAERIYGTPPKEAPEIRIGLLEEGSIIDERTGATRGHRRQLGVTLSRAGNTIGVNVLIQAPSADRAYPALISPTIYGNHSVTKDPNVIPSEAYTIVGLRERIQFREEHRGYKQDRFNMDAIVDSGRYAAVTFSYHDIVPDAKVSSDTAAYSLYPELANSKHAPRAIAMWAWGMTQVARAVGTDSIIDQNRMAVMGFSRLGKAVHVALAHEHPFKAGISVASGKAGAAPLKVGEGEPSLFMAATYPHWFHIDFPGLVAPPGKVPFGQKYLLAESNVPTLVSVDETDWWSAPRQQERAVNSANKMRLKRGLRPTLEFITHNAGGHTVSPDWQGQYIHFLDRHLLPGGGTI